MSAPDPETETVDLRRKLWNIQRLGESMAEDRDETVRRCGEQVLAVLGDAVLPVGDVLDPKHLQAALEALSTAVAGAEYEHQKKRYKAAWAYLDALEGKDSAEEERLPRLCPACLHDGVLERTLGRAEAAEGNLARIRSLAEDMLGYFRSEEETEGFTSGHVQALVPTPQVHEWHVRFRLAIIGTEEGSCG